MLVVPKRLGPKLDVVFETLFAVPENRDLLCSQRTEVLTPSSPIVSADVNSPELPRSSRPTRAPCSRMGRDRWDHVVGLWVMDPSGRGRSTGRQRRAFEHSLGSCDRTWAWGRASAAVGRGLWFWMVGRHHQLRRLGNRIGRTAFEGLLNRRAAERAASAGGAW